MGADDTELTNQRGLLVLSHHVLNGLGWYIRHQFVSDFGIDAHVELRSNDGPTGRLIFVQAKTGPSWFREPTERGWVFRFEERHARYWRDHAVPVVVVLIDLNTQQAYWQHINDHTVVSTGENYKVEVLRNQVVADSAAAWEHLASELSVQAPLRYPAALDRLPPAAARRLEALHRDPRPGSRQAAECAACWLADGRRDAAGTVRTLLLTAPVWLAAGGAAAWRAVSTYAVEHGEHELSAAALLRAAALSVPVLEKAELMAVAALHHMVQGTERATILARHALRLAPASPRARVVMAIVENGLGDAHPVPLPPDIAALDVASDHANSPAPLQDVVVRHVLAENASRRGDVDLAVHHREALFLLHQGDSDVATGLAEALLRRSRHPEARSDDLPRARELLTAAVQERRRWDGDTSEALWALMVVLLGQRDAAAVLAWALPPPRGTATLQEAQRQNVLRAAVEAACELRDEQLARQLVDGLDASGLSAILRAEVLGRPLGTVEREAAWREELRTALEEPSAGELVHQRLTAVLGLAELGVDEADALDDVVARGLIARRFQQFARARALAVRDLPRALPRLRSLARGDLMTAQKVVELLEAAGQTDEALRVCDAAREQFSDEGLSAVRVAVLRSAGRWDEAYAAAEEALARGGVAGVPAAQLHHLLARRAGEARQWPAAQRHLEQANAIQSPPPPEGVWNLTMTHLNQQRPARAAEVLRRYRPPVRDASDAQIWLQVWLAAPPGSEEAAQGIELAERFSDDPRLSSALLTTVVMNTRTDDGDEDGDDTGDARADVRRRVPGELHTRAFLAMNALVERHGAATGITILQGSDEELVAQTIALARERHERTEQQRAAFHEVAELVRSGQVPGAILSQAHDCACVTGLLDRLAGVQVAGSLSDDEHESEVAEAAAALDGAVVVDAAALVLCTALPRGTEMRDLFSDVIVPTAVVADAARAQREIRGRMAWTSTLGWDPHEERLRVWEVPQDDRARAAERAAAVVAAAQSASSVDVDPESLHSLFAEGRMEGDGERANKAVSGLAGHAPWLAPVGLARTRQLALWSDDLAVRRFARSNAVAAFGTPALLQAVLRRDLDEAGEPAQVEQLLQRHRDDVLALVEDRVVDIPVSLSELQEVARGHRWQPGAAAVVLSRPLWWVLPAPALRGTAVLLSEAAEQDVALVEQWAHFAMTGAAATFTQLPHVAATLVAALATCALTVVLPDGVADDDGDETGDDERTEVVARVFGVAADVAAARHLPDPRGFVGAAADLLAKVLQTSDTQSGDGDRG